MYVLCIYMYIYIYTFNVFQIDITIINYFYKRLLKYNIVYSTSINTKPPDRELSSDTNLWNGAKIF